MNSLIQKYEMFQMQQEKTIYDVHKGFTHIVNNFSRLGKTFDTDETSIKNLKSLNRSSQPKVTAIIESQNLTTMSFATLFAKFKRK